MNFLLSSAVSLLPLYAWASGGLQISHYILLVYCILFFFRNGVGRGGPDLLLLVLAFYLFLRESISVSDFRAVRALLAPAHLIFSLIVFNVLRRSLQSEWAMRHLRGGLLISAAVSVCGVFIFGYSLTVDVDGGRAIGTFNNPNQLGYFSVCLLAIAFLLKMSGQMSMAMFLSLFATAVFLALASLSKAAMLSILVPILTIGFYSRRRGSFLIGAAIVLLLIFLAGYFYSAGYLDDYSFVQRIQGIGSQSDDSLAGRGYSVIFLSSPLELLFGFGLNNVLILVGHEVHSTVFSFFVNYGIIGGLIFLGFLLMWANRVFALVGWRGVISIVVPVMLFGLTHNGSRFTIFWILLALTFSLSAGKYGGR